LRETYKHNEEEFNMKITKKYLFILMVMISVIVLAACGGSDGESSGDGEKKAKGGIIPIYTPGTAGSNYILSAGITNLLNENEAVEGSQFSTEATSGDIEMLTLLLDRSDQDLPAFAATSAYGPNTAYFGKHPEMEGEYEDLRAVSYVSYSAMHLVVKENSDIHSFEDLKGKKIGAFVPGLTPDIYMKDFLSEAYGIEPDEYTSIPLNHDERATGIQDGSVDASFLLGAVPLPQISELSQMEDIRIIPMDEEKVNEFIADKPHFDTVLVEAGTYDGHDEDLLIGRFSSIYVTHKNTDDEIVYEFIKQTIENHDKLLEVHPSADITLDTALDGIELPLHDGAKKYYEEEGLTVD